MTRLTESARGVFVIAATPFTADGALDLPSVDRLVDFYLGHRVHGLTLLGIMGEAPKLTAEESLAVVRRVLARVAGRVPVVVGVSSAGLAPLAALADGCMQAGAAGVMVAPTPGLRGDDALFAYMEAVFRALDPATPVVYQDYPQATGVYLAVPLLHLGRQVAPGELGLDLEGHQLVGEPARRRLNRQVLVGQAVHGRLLGRS